MATHSRLPKYNELLNPLFQAVHDQIAANRGFDRFSTIFIHYARFDTQRCTVTRDQRIAEARNCCLLET